MYSLSEILTLTERGTHENTILAAAIGLIFPLIAERQLSNRQNLAWHVDKISKAVKLHQLQIYFDRFGRLAGHVMWTLIAPDKEKVLLKNGPEALMPSDFSNQGDAWILDMTARFGELAGILAKLRDVELRHLEVVTYFRYKRGRRIAKRVARADQTSFFQRPSLVSTCEPGIPFLMRKEGNNLLFAATTEVDSAIQLGRSLMLLRTVPEYAAMPMVVVLTRVRIPMEQMQSRLYASETGDPIAYMTWAWVNRDELNANQRRDLHARAPFEWSEGDDLCLCDAVSTPQGMKAITADLASEWFPKEDLWVYPRNTGNTCCTTSPVRWTPERRSELETWNTQVSSVLDVASALVQQGGAL